MAAAADARGREAGTPRAIPSRGWLDLIGAEINAEMERQTGRAGEY